MTLTFAEPTEWWVAIAPPTQNALWQSSPVRTTAPNRWTAYLNHLCLQTFLPWLQEEYTPAARSWLSPQDFAAVWEVVGGMALTLGNTRCVLIPTDAIDGAELEVPQEWVDIPGWAADYYLAVQLKVNDPGSNNWLRVWGYTTHQTLKQSQNYDPEDRTYCLDAGDLDHDLSAFWLTHLYGSQEQTQAAIAPLPALTDTQADNLIQRLGNPAVTFPRLAVPFAQWGALLEREEWRQRLYQQRTGQTSAPNLTQLGQWLQGQISSGWQSVESLFGRELMPAFRQETGDEITQAKRLDLPVPVVLLVGLQEAEGRVGIRAQVHPTDGNPHVPADLTLALLSDTGEVLQSVQAQDQDDYIQLRRFRCPPGTRFSLQVNLSDRQITEAFTV